MRHRFRLKGVPAKLRVQFKVDDEPRANQKYRFEVDGANVKEGYLKSDGMLEVSIPPNARAARVFVGEGADRALYTLNLGHVDPAAHIGGVQHRLINLGYSCEETGELDAATRTALLTFQQRQGLPQTGELDDQTRSKLVDAHGC
jgi:hypothetical protein